MSNNLDAPKVKILNIELDNVGSSQLLSAIKQGGVLFTPNVYSVVKLQKDAEFLQVYQNADYVVCNSKILLWASKFLGKEIQENISISDFFVKFYQHYQYDRDIKIFLLGGAPGVAKLAQEKINNKLARPIVVGAYSPTLDFEKNEGECQKIIHLIERSGATVLAIGVDAPKPEKWIDKYKNQLSKIKIFLGIDEAIDFEAEVARRPPKWVSNVGLEWLYKLILNPRRWWKRYLVESLPFFLLVLQQKINSYKYQKSPQLKRQNLPFSSTQTHRAITTKLPKVIMFGPCLSEQGGMGAVQREIVQSLTERVAIRHVATWNGKTSTLTLFIKALIFFLDKLIKNQVDLVHVHISERGSALRKSILALLAFAFSKPVIMHTHGCEFHIFHAGLPTIIKQALNKIFQKCAYVIVLSQSWKKTYIDICNLNPEKVLVLYNPVTVPQRIPVRINSDRISFLLVGKINQRKGVFDLLQAIATLPPDTQKKMQLVIAGSGEIEKAIALTRKLDIESLVSFPGWVNTWERDRLLGQADAFILPSYNEGLPMALLEAMSWRLPAITTPVGGIPEIITHQKTGLLIEPGDISALAASIKTLIDDESLRLTLGDEAYQQASKLDINNYSRDILNMYYSTINKHLADRLRPKKNQL
jgi:exopolysaccharide biosynthesis WecB/TagA/CpsF family protein